MLAPTAVPKPEGSVLSLAGMPALATGPGSTRARHVLHLLGLLFIGEWRAPARAERFHHWPGWHSWTLSCNRHTQHMPLSVPIAFEAPAMAWSLTEDPIRAEESSCANVMSAELRAVMQHELVGRARGEPVGGDGQHDGTVRPCAQGPTERAVEGPVEADVRFSTFTTDILTQRACLWVCAAVPVTRCPVGVCGRVPPSPASPCHDACFFILTIHRAKPLFCGRHGGDAFSPRSSGRLAASGPRLPTQVIDHGIVCTIHAVFCPQKTARASEFSIMLTNIFFPDTDRQEAQQYFSQHHAATKGALSARTRAQCHCCTGAAFFHARHARFAHNIVHTLGLF